MQVQIKTICIIIVHFIFDTYSSWWFLQEILRVGDRQKCHPCFLAIEVTGLTTAAAALRCRLRSVVYVSSSFSLPTPTNWASTPRLYYPTSSAGTSRELNDGQPKTEAGKVFLKDSSFWKSVNVCFAFLSGFYYLPLLSGIGIGIGIKGKHDLEHNEHTQ